MREEEIITKIKNYVKSVCENDTSGHDWWHIKRVYNSAMLINQKEKSNEIVLSIIVFMHDLYDHKFYDGNPAEALERTLKELQVYEYLSEDDIQNIIYSCVNLGFSSNLIEKKELSLEGKIAQDADKLDGLGAMGIARTFIYGGKQGKPMYDPENLELINGEEYYKNGSKTSISHFYDKILKLKDLMNTKTAKIIAEERHKFVEKFLEEFLAEWSGER